MSEGEFKMRVHAACHSLQPFKQHSSRLTVQRVSMIWQREQLLYSLIGALDLVGSLISG